MEMQGEVLAYVTDQKGEASHHRTQDCWYSAISCGYGSHLAATESRAIGNSIQVISLSREEEGDGRMALKEEKEKAMDVLRERDSRRPMLPSTVPGVPPLSMEGGRSLTSYLQRVGICMTAITQTRSIQSPLIRGGQDPSLWDNLRLCIEL